ncbi:MAG TPA: hypothetical protein VNI20_09555 [Fimbriimonadaceae bacterium]|nr:hypothetical protein [Fimbriimonadaceae bacterium]
MSEAPNWWYQATGVAAICLVLMCLCTIVVLWYVLMTLTDLRHGINAITERLKTLTGRVDSIAKQVEQVTTEVGSRTVGITRMVDDVAGGAFDVIERFPPAVLGAAVLFKLASLFRKKN